MRRRDAASDQGQRGRHHRRCQVQDLWLWLGDRVLVGAPFSQTPPLADQGRAYLYDATDRTAPALIRTIDPGDLKIRIRSRQDLAIYCLEYDRYWEGEITVPFLELFENQHPDYTVVGE